MLKKSVGLIIAVIMLLGVFGLTACNNDTLDAYKIEGKAKIDAHVATKIQSDYSTEKWAELLNIAAEGKQAVENATSKIAIDTAVEKTKESIDMGYYEIEVEDMIELYTWHFTSGIPNNVIKVIYSDEKAIFECSVDNGNLWLLGPTYEKCLTVKPNDKFRWQAEIDGTEKAFVEIILKIDNKIIGYAVIKIDQIENCYIHSARILKSIFFPKIDGKHQDITQNQVKSFIEKIKADKEGI